jgi:hypothetical protein
MSNRPSRPGKPAGLVAGDETQMSNGHSSLAIRLPVLTDAPGRFRLTDVRFFCQFANLVIGYFVPAG